MMPEQVYSTLYLIVLICDAAAMALTLIRCVTALRVVDRIICINMMCNEATLAIAVLALYLKESYLLDVSLVYVMLSFLAVLILCKVYVTVYLKHKKKVGSSNDI